MAHPPLCPFSAKSNGFSVSPVSKGEKTAKIGRFSSPQQLRRQTTPLSERVASESCILQKVQIHHEEATGQKFVPKAKKF
jgi:hypothetical protein